MSASHLQRMMTVGTGLGLVAGLLLSSPAMAESLGGKKVRTRRRAPRSTVEKPHKPTEMDRMLMPAPDFPEATAPVGGMVISAVHWDPFRPEAERLFTVTAGRKDGLRLRDRLVVWRGPQQVTVAEVEVVRVGEEQAQLRVRRRPDPDKSMPLEHEAIMKGDKASLLMRPAEDIWPAKKKKRRRRKRIIKRPKPKPIAQAAATSLLPAGKETIVINGRELPKNAPKGLRLNPAQLPVPKPEAK